MNSPQAHPSGPPSVLVVLAHPDDPEFFCGGTVARWSSEGAEITYCLLTRGDKGADGEGVDPEDLARLREEEQRQAAKVLGVASVMFLDRPDGMLQADIDLRRDIARVIRSIRPERLITCDPTTLFPRRQRINHADHRAAGQATLDAVYPAAGSALYFPELLEEGLQPHKVREVFVAGSQDPNMGVDITDHMDRKLEALRCHRSQLPDFDEIAAYVKERLRDPGSPSDRPRYVERFLRLEPFG
ncbi:MAG TPA: PIG-L deacetylase family protein [Anaerolineales bacterium]|nr:PIG-L deacetylase family protein [Anaerolineales bacterium]